MGLEGRMQQPQRSSNALEAPEPAVEGGEMLARIRAVSERARAIGESLHALPESTSEEKKKRIGEKVGEIGTMLSSLGYRVGSYFIFFKGVGIAAAGGVGFQISLGASGLFIAAGTVLIALALAMNEAADKKWQEYRGTAPA